MRSKLAQMQIITLVVFVVVGIAAGLAIFYDFAVIQQRIATATNEEVENSEVNTTVTLNNPKMTGATTVVNRSCGIADSCNSTMREGSEYSLDTRKGIIKFINRTGTWNVSYNYKPGMYAETQTNRTILGLLPLLLALFVLIIIGKKIIGGPE